MNREQTNGNHCDKAGNKSRKSSIADKLLPLSYQVSEFDVMCGRGRTCFGHVGNKRFRAKVDELLDQYASSTTKVEKSWILSQVVDHVRRTCKGGFLKKDTASGRWYDVGDFLAREKTSQAFRDALHAQYRSSNKSKKRKRQAEQAKASENLSKIAKSQLDISSKIEKLSHDVQEAESDLKVDALLNKANFEILSILNQVSQFRKPEDGGAFEKDFGVFHQVHDAGETLQQAPSFLRAVSSDNQRQLSCLEPLPYEGMPVFPPGPCL